MVRTTRSPAESQKNVQDVPDKIRERDTTEHKFRLDGWVRCVRVLVRVRVRVRVRVCVRVDVCTCVCVCVCV